MQLLLKYLYTGECLFPRDDLNLGIELMAAADQFLLEAMKMQCERALSEKIDVEVSDYYVFVALSDFKSYFRNSTSQK